LKKDTPLLFKEGQGVVTELCLGLKIKKISWLPVFPKGKPTAQPPLNSLRVQKMSPHCPEGITMWERRGLLKHENNDL